MADLDNTEASEKLTQLCAEVCNRVSDELELEKARDPGKFMRQYGRGHVHANALSYFRDRVSLTFQEKGEQGVKEWLAHWTDHVRIPAHRALFPRFYHVLCAEASRLGIILPDMPPEPPPLASCEL